MPDYRVSDEGAIIFTKSEEEVYLENLENRVKNLEDTVHKLESNISELSKYLKL